MDGFHYNYSDKTDWVCIYSSAIRRRVTHKKAVYHYLCSGINTKKHYGLTITMLQAYCSSASSQALADVWAWRQIYKNLCSLYWSQCNRCYTSFFEADSTGIWLVSLASLHLGWSDNSLVTFINLLWLLQEVKRIEMLIINHLSMARYSSTCVSIAIFQTFELYTNSDPKRKMHYEFFFVGNNPSIQYIVYIVWSLSVLLIDPCMGLRISRHFYLSMQPYQ